MNTNYSNKPLSIETRTKEIELAKERYNKHLQYVEDQQHITQLLFQDLVKTIKNETEYPPLFSGPFMHNAYNYWSFRSRYKDDKVKQEQFMDFEQLFKSVLIPDDVPNEYDLTVTAIYQGCFDCLYYKIHFTINGKSLALVVPNIKALDTNNFKDAYKGQCVLFENETDYVCNWIQGSYNFNEITQKLLEYLEVPSEIPSNNQ